jgi:hypothetical protein
MLRGVFGSLIDVFLVRLNDGIGPRAFFLAHDTSLQPGGKMLSVNRLLIVVALVAWNLCAQQTSTK